MNDMVIFKHEDEVMGVAHGPVWVRRDGRQVSFCRGAWVSLGIARGLAELLLLPLREE